MNIKIFIASLCVALAPCFYHPALSQDASSAGMATVTPTAVEVESVEGEGEAKSVEVEAKSVEVEPVEGEECQSTPLYRALEKQLDVVNTRIQYDEQNDSEPLVVDFDGEMLKEGDSHKNIPLLRARMMPYLSMDSFNVDPYVYDPSLVEAVKAFQEKMGLKKDGIIGQETLSLINRTLLDEKKQILVNMDRLCQPEFSNRPSLRIEVNIPQYELMAFEDNDVVFDMPVVVGSPLRQTVNFMTVMTGVRLNPDWTLPPTIKTEDYIPKLRENPQWVNDNGVEIYASWNPEAEPIDPTTVDWNYLTDNEIKAMRFYKIAGNSNPLGRYRFLMNNQHDIYLHDTNKKYLFDRAQRAKSSGCVRVYDPRKIAEFLLADDKGWTSEKLDEVLEKGETFDLGASRSIPVYFDYVTAWLDKAGNLILGYDIYGFDEPFYDGIIGSKSKNKVEKTL